MRLSDRFSRRAVRLLALTACLTAITPSLSAEPTINEPLHPEGTLKLANPILVAGTEVELGGEEFDDGSVLKIFLVGLSGRFELVEVTANSAGGFTTTLVLDNTLEPGAYRLVALAADGDEAATLNVEVRPATAMAMVADEDHDGDGDHGEDEHSGGMEASGEHMELDRARSPLVTGGAIFGIILALGAGGVLLRTPKA